MTTDRMKISRQKAITLTQIRKLEAKIKTTIVKNAHSGVSKINTIKDIQKLILSNLKVFNILENPKYYIDSSNYWANVYANSYYKKINAIKTSLFATLLLLKNKSKEEYQEINKKNILPLDEKQNVLSPKEEKKKINVVKNIVEKLKKFKTTTPIKEAINIIDDEHIIEYAKGLLPNMPNYKKMVKDEMNLLATRNFGGIPTIDKNGRVYYGRSLFASAERDIRFNYHFQKINEMKAKGVTNVWVTSHANCSKRCQPFQGRAYTLDGTTRTIDGITLEPIENATEIYVTTKSGKVWRNGLFGFNCRHDLKEFTPRSKAPVSYSAEEIDKMRGIESKQRAFERRLYQIDMQRAIYESAGDKESLSEANRLRQKYKILETKYKLFCEKNQVKPQPSRYKTWL